MKEGGWMKNFWGHFRTINHHKWLVMSLCFRCGLIKQGLLHDLSKYSITEFSTGVKYFQGNRSPNGIDRKENGYSAAWLHHKGRNKHHWEYWSDLIHGECIPVQMPVRYLVEMWCDRIAATKVYEKEHYSDASALAYFQKNYDNVIMHPKTKDLLAHLLQYSADHGCDNTISYIKEVILPQGYDVLKVDH